MSIDSIVIRELNQNDQNDQYHSPSLAFLVDLALIFANHFPPATMDAQSNLRVAYNVLEDRVNTALRTQLGDAERIAGTRGEALSLMEMFEQVCKLNHCTVVLLIDTSSNHICFLFKSCL